VNGMAVWYGSNVSFPDMLNGQAHTSNPDAIAFVNAVQTAKETAQVH
jgi:hypothetical protein